MYIIGSNISRTTLGQKGATCSMSPQINPIFAVRGELKDHKYVSGWSPASPWPDVDVAFHWTNFDYPRAHIHEYWEILVLVSGTLRHQVNGKSTILNEHHACLLRPDDCHSLFAANSEPVIVLNFMAKKDYATRLFAAYGQDMTDRILNSEDLSFTVSEATLNKCIVDTQFLQIDKTLSDEEKSSRCKILFISLISELMMQNVTIAKSYPQWLSSFLMKLSQSNYSVRSIKTDLVADSTYSYSRLIHLFKKHMGCTIAQYIAHQRVERAKEYLRYTNMRIIDIAAAVGCDSVTHFNRIFKQSTGVTPTQFRQSNSNVSDDHKGRN